MAHKPNRKRVARASKEARRWDALEQEYLLQQAETRAFQHWYWECGGRAHDDPYKAWEELSK